MSFAWLKPYMPRSLYGRAALILVLPVVTLQLVVSVVFIKRHFDGVTEQMASAFAREVRLVLETPNAAQRLGVAGPLDIALSPVPGWPEGDSALWYDLTASIVQRELRAQIPQIRAVVLPDLRQAQLFLQAADGPLLMVVDRRRLSASNPHQLLVHMVVFGALMTVIAFIYLRNQLRPIKRLANAAEAFGRGRMVPYRPSGATEVRAAGNAFLDMRARIERQIEQRTLMLSGVSHDLRTPLTRLKLGLSLLDHADRAEMERDVAEMQQMLDAFLSFAKGASEGEPQLCDPISLTESLVEDCRRKGQAVILALVEGQGQVQVRPIAIRRALDNLISNAVRYAQHAEVSVLVSDRAVRWRVEDDGPGIPPDLRGDALRPFTRLDTARNQNAGASVGLGLAIAADIARAHGGVLRLSESARMGGLQADIVIAR